MWDAKPPVFPLPSATKESKKRVVSVSSGTMNVLLGLQGMVPNTSLSASLQTAQQNAQLAAQMAHDTRPGPDAEDDPVWERLSSDRQKYLLAAGDHNARMEEYIQHIREKHAAARSQPEQWTVFSRTLLEVNEAARPNLTCPGPEPVPQPVGLMLWAVVSGLLLVGAVVWICWLRGWRHPFGGRVCPRLEDRQRCLDAWAKEERQSGLPYGLPPVGGGGAVVDTPTYDPPLGTGLQLGRDVTGHLVASSSK